MSITQTITLYTGTVPNSATQTQTQFNAAANDWLDHQKDLPAEYNTFASQANALAAEVNQHLSDAESAKDTALAAANFLGDWADQSGAVSVPAAVRHDGFFWLLLADVANVASSEPGVSGDWALLQPSMVVEEFTTSGTYTKYAQSKLVIVDALIGAGAGGSSGESSGTTGSKSGGGGGGGGMFAKATFLPSQLGATETVTIGAGGSGGSGDLVSGSAGGSSQFGSLLQARGGRAPSGGLGGGFRDYLSLSNYDWDSPYQGGQGGTSYDENAHTGIASQYGGVGGSAGGWGFHEGGDACARLQPGDVESANVTGNGSDGSYFVGAEGGGYGEPGGNGGNGGYYGNGGGGGGAGGTTSGDGGDGGDGYCRIITLF